MTKPITYTTKTRIVGVNMNSPSFRGWEPTVEVELRSDIGQPLTLNGTLGFVVPPPDLPVEDSDTLLNAQVEVTVRLLTKQTRVVPWKAEEVPLGCEIRSREVGAGRFILTGVCGDRVYSGENYWSLHTLPGWDYSSDGGKTWKPAGRVEEVYD